MVLIMSVVVSVRIPRWLKEKLEKYGVNIAEVVRRSLLEELKRREEEEIMKQLDALSNNLKHKIDLYELSRIIDEERKGR